VKSDKLSDRVNLWGSWEAYSQAAS